MLQDYFSITEIAATEERVLCTINENIEKLGYLDSSSETDYLKAGTKLELPFWMASQFCTRLKLISCDIPKIYKQNYREILKADSSVVLLSKWNPYYYEFGMQLTKISEQRDLIIESLLEAFKSRVPSIMDQAFNPISDSSIPFQLPAVEKDLFLTGRKCNNELISWIEKGTRKIETAQVVTSINMKKRKRKELNVE